MLAKDFRSPRVRPYGLSSERMAFWRVGVEAFGLLPILYDQRAVVRRAEF